MTPPESNLAISGDWEIQTRSRSGRRHISLVWVSVMAQCLDVALILSSALAAHLFRFGWETSHAGANLVATLMIVVLAISLSHRFDLFTIETLASWPRKISRLPVIMAAVFLLLAGLAFALRISEDFSRIWVFSTFAASIAVTIIARGALKHLLGRMADAGLLQENVAIVGATDHADSLLARVSPSALKWYNFVGIFDNRVQPPATSKAGCPVRGDLRQLERLIRDGEIGSVVIALPWDAGHEVLEVAQKLNELPVNLYLGADPIAYRFPNTKRSSLAGVPLFEIAAMPFAGWSAVIKLLEDKVLAFALIVFLLPLMFLICMAIKLETPGPAMFRQKRFGFNNEPFVIHKFRTMYVGGPEQKGVPQARHDDPRVTRVGRLLRRTSLDELPQLLDVLRGTMSLVGPRPHAVEHNHMYCRLVQGYDTRHKVKPGITGWAQVNGWRGETDKLDKMMRRIEHDIYYVEHWSLWFDLEILFLTLRRAWVDRNAY
jgi:putative colanic acid biosysnthesis UDP-glucose lipid carrier transferase